MNEINQNSELLGESRERTPGERPSFMEWLVLGGVAVPAYFCFGWIMGDVLSHTVRTALLDTTFDWLVGAISFAAFVVGLLVIGLIVGGAYSLTQSISRRLWPGTTVTEWLEKQESEDFDAAAYAGQGTVSFTSAIVRILIWSVLCAGCVLLFSSLTGPRIQPPLLFSGDFELWASYVANALVFIGGGYFSLVIATGGAVLTAAVQKRVEDRKSVNEAA